jgi:hypothetical protein
MSYVLHALVQLSLGALWMFVGMLHARRALYRQMCKANGLTKSVYTRALWPNLEVLNRALDRKERERLHLVVELAVTIFREAPNVTTHNKAIDRLVEEAMRDFPNDVDISLFLNDDEANPARAKQCLEEKS